MRHKGILAGIALLVLCASSAFAEKSYWITFSDSFYYTQGASAPTGGRKFVMKIDQDGNILMDPVVMFDMSGLKAPSGATAIWDQGDVLLFWTPAEFGSNGYKIGRGVFNPATNTTTSFVVTNLETSDPDFLQAGKYKNGFAFLTYEKSDTGGERAPQSPQRADNGSLRAAEVNSNGLVTNNRWRLCPRTDGGNDQGGVAADGVFALSNDHDSPPDKLYTQRLNSLNTPSGNPKVVTNFENTFANIESVDVTNDQGNGLRFVLYQLGFGDRAIDPNQPSIVLQRIDAVTGDKKGKPILISDDFRFDWRQVIAVDPDGDFVVFTSAGDNVPAGGEAGVVNQKQQGCEELMYQALNNKGQPSGSPIVLVDGCDLEIFSMMGLDIALD